MFTEAENRYQYRIKQDKIEAQNILIEYTQRQKLWLFFGIICAVAFIVLLIVLYRKLDKRSKALQLLNQKLEEANNTKAKLFAIISHDFRSPVNQVYQLLKLQQSKNIIIDPAEKMELETQTQDAISNLLESMEELLLWSKTQMQSFNMVSEKVCIHKICLQCTDLLQALIHAKQLQLNIQVPAGSSIITDPNFLLAILRNLLQNAIKASPRAEQIIIRYEHRNGHSFLRILNKGPAFTHQDYVQALSNASNILKGGLGLLIVDELSRKMDADILFGLEDEYTYCDIIFKSDNK